MIEAKNPAAVALGKLARGIRKTGLTRAERKRRGQAGREALIRWHRKEGHALNPS